MFKLVITPLCIILWLAWLPWLPTAFEYRVTFPVFQSAGADVMNVVQKGFTLIELMIVVVIVAILATIAYPAYTDQVRKTARKEVIGVLLDTAGRLERIRSQTFSYQAINADSTNRYGVVVNVPAGGATFTITATPAGDQANDRCGVIVLNQQGAWTFTQGGNAVAQDLCM